MSADIAIIGLGLMGASLAQALRRLPKRPRVIGYDSNMHHATTALTRGWIDDIAPDLASAAQAKLVMIAAPLGPFPAIMEALAPHLPPGAVVSDVGSAKLCVLEWAKQILPPHAVFVPGHPIAGKEKTGPEAASPALFEGRLVLLTPEIPDMHSAMRDVHALWQSVGAKIEFMPPALHDTIYAHVSHLPHLLAFALGALLPQIAKHDPIAQHALRIAGASPSLWADIFIANRPALLSAVEAYLPMVEQIETEFTIGKIKGEAAEAPTQENALLVTHLLLHLTASLLVATLSISEQKHGIAMNPYAGAGLQDFIYPVYQVEEDVFAQLSKHYLAVLPVLEQFRNSVRLLANLIEKEDRAALCQALEERRTRWLHTTH